MNKEAREKIKSLKEKIKDHDKTIKKYDKQIKQLKKDRDIFIDKKEYLENQIEQVIAEEWRKDAKNGKFKNICYYSDIPKIILREWSKIEKGITGGCTGDWYDGCRGCEKHCSSKAKEAFMKLYNIGRITWGSEKDRKKK